MSRRFVFDTVFGQMLGNSASVKTSARNEEALLGDVSTRVPDRTDNEKTTEPFIYTPLYGPGSENGSGADDPANPPLRLLDLLPGTRQDDIECRLRTCTSLAAVRGTYEALSYVWGDMRETTPIQVDGATLHIGRSLRAALLNLRSAPDEAADVAPRTLWADAVCIDEASVDERERQVVSMGAIYRGAARTVVWLGDAKPSVTALAYYTVQMLGVDAQQVQARQAAAGGSATAIVVQPRHGAVYEHLKADDAVTEDLLRRPWWQRVWTAQEIVLAKAALLVCGRYQVDWDFFCDAVYHGLALEVWERMVLGTYVKQDFVFFESIRRLRSGLRRNLADNASAAAELLDLLLDTRRRRATDPRDKIFGVLGLMRAPLDTLDILPDYTSAVADVYHKACMKLLVHSGNLDVLGACFAFDDPLGVVDLPSWVPNWDPPNIIAQPLLNLADGTRRSTQHASKRSVCTPAFAAQGRTLVVEGHQVDEIAAVSAVLREIDDSIFSSDVEFTDDMPLSETLRELAGLFGQAFEAFGTVIPHLATYVEWEKFTQTLRPSNPDPRTADPMDIYWQTLCAGMLAPGGYDETARLFWDWYKTLEPIRGLVKWKVSKSLVAFKSMGFLAYLRSTWRGYGDFFAFLRQCTERRLGSTARGYLCLLPKSAQVGDRLMLIKGGRVPLVLRAGDDENLTLIGEAYVHGIMDGAAFDESRCSSVRIR